MYSTVHERAQLALFYRQYTAYTSTLSAGLQFAGYTQYYGRTLDTLKGPTILFLHPNSFTQYSVRVRLVLDVVLLLISLFTPRMSNGTVFEEGALGDCFLLAASRCR